MSSNSLISFLISLIPAFVWLLFFGGLFWYIAISGLFAHPPDSLTLLLFLVGAGFFAAGLLVLKLGYIGGYSGWRGGTGSGAIGGGGGSSGGGGAGR